MSFYVDMHGKFIPPGSLHRKVVADFTGSIPAGFSVRQTGVYADTTYEAVGTFSLKLQLPTGASIGKGIRIDGPAIEFSTTLSDGNAHQLLAAKISARIVGGGKLGTAGTFSPRTMSLGWRDATDQNGAVLQDRPNNVNGCYLQGVAGGVVTEQKIDMIYRGESKRFDPELWMIRTTTGWDLVASEHDSPFEIRSFTAAELGESASMVPFIEWIKVQAAGEASVHMLQVEIDYWWQ